MGIDEAMAVGRARYADALAELGRFGPAVFTQTGGMCAALEVTLERGYLLVTAAEDSLPWDRAELTAWGVGFYSTEDAGEGPEVFVDSADSGDTSVTTLGVLVRRCLRDTSTMLRARP